ncbi:hypothetical protein SASPL_125786 [Salvia splendens]|uniref:Uncharacterized protein n=1 Tax=Salvia splendens TaxID=180675 RepID=A0A8X8XKM6_SALSN|nr:hypothetical protein SASPL_125786 [Salvia splendens]
MQKRNVPKKEKKFDGKAFGWTEDPNVVISFNSLTQSFNSTHTHTENRIQRCYLQRRRLPMGASPSQHADHLPLILIPLLLSSTSKLSYLLLFLSRSESLWELQRKQNEGLFPRRITGQAIRVLANPNVCTTPGFCIFDLIPSKYNVLGRHLQRKENLKKEVIMVDPSEAKRLAAKQMELIKAKEEFKRRRQIEAINGAWAMIGLTVGLVIEGQTGKSILAQVTLLLLAGYWDAIVGFIVR